MKPIEILPVLNENYEITGKAPRVKFHNNPEGKMLHPVVHLHLINTKGQIFLQQRPFNKLIQPGKWDTAVGGHVSYGEGIETALLRETMEEIGINAENARFINQYVWESEAEKELVNMYVLFSDEKPKINPDELSDGKFWNSADISNLRETDTFTPNFLQEFDYLIEMKVIQA